MVLEEDLKNKLKKYKSLTQQALNVVEIAVEQNSPQYDLAVNFLDSAKNYFNDAKYFEEKGDFLTALASFSYAHAWLDAGVKAKILKGTDDRLFAG